MKKVISFLLAMLLLATPLTVFADNVWYCPQCGRKNTENYCPVDGRAKPSNLGSNSGNTASGRRVSVRDRITLGHYEQDKNTSNGSEAVKWVVLDVNGSYALITSVYVLDGREFHSRHYNVNWRDSDLRQWLNNTFLYNCFSASERRCIASVTLPEGTVDTVFLLSKDEAEHYFRTDASRMCVATAYATSQICHQVNGLGEKAHCRWWLRTIGNEGHSAMYISHYQGNVMTEGFLDSYYGTGSDDKYHWVGVRPALWIDTALL